jgi:hypothetical protein
MHDMSDTPVIRQNKGIERVDEVRQPEALSALAVPGKWRRLTMRLGAFELGYASVRVSPQNSPRQDSRYPALPGRVGLRSRFMEHLGFTAVAVVLLAGVIVVLAMRSNAFVTSSGNKWPIVDARDGAAATGSKARAVKAAIPEKEKPTPVPAAATLQPSIVQAAIRDGIADMVRRGEMQGAIPSASPAQAPAGLDAARSAVMAGTLDRIPAVAAAIKRAMATGEMQNWAAGDYAGVVVIGQGFEKDGAVCREGSILARDGGPDGQTQTFERCSKGK